MQGRECPCFGLRHGRIRLTTCRAHRSHVPRSRARCSLPARATGLERACKVVLSSCTKVLASVLAAAVTLSCCHATASLPASDLSALSYDLNLKKRNQHGTPDRGFEASLELDEDMFVPDAWNAMQRYHDMRLACSMQRHSAFLYS